MKKFFAKSEIPAMYEWRGKGIWIELRPHASDPWLFEVTPERPQRDDDPDAVVGWLTIQNGELVDVSGGDVYLPDELIGWLREEGIRVDPIYGYTPVAY